MATNIVVAKYVSGLMVKIHNIPHIKWIRSVHVTYIHQPEANPFKQFKMATEKSFEFVVLSELNLPEDLFSILKGKIYFNEFFYLEVNVILSIFRSEL